VVPQTYGRLFLRFLRFGLLAWGGPVAQIAMLRKELVDEERWVTSEHFNRVFAVYQVLPGPEAHELCVYFGMRAGGRLGGVLAGLGFMLPGFILMFALSWAYVQYGMQAAVFAAVFYGTQPAIAAVVFRAVHRIGGSVLHDPWSWAAAGAAAIGEAAGLPFLLMLPTLGLAYVLARRRLRLVAILLLALTTGVSIALLAGATAPRLAGVAATTSRGGESPNLVELFASGLRTGLLTFGGAYTAIPFLRNDAVNRSGWMTDDQFLDGLALSGILPAPLIIFATFVGYIGGGPLGSLALTAGVFLPAFAFTLVAHEPLERLVTRPGVNDFLLGVTAAVVGLIAVAAIQLARTAWVDIWTIAIAAAVLLLLYTWHSKLAVAVAVAGGGLVGWLIRHM
jgi:chromate transporter